MNTIPEVSCESFQLYIKQHSKVTGTYWNPVGLKSNSVERAKNWLHADFNIWKEKPKAEFKVVKTTSFKDVSEDVEFGKRL